MTPKWLKELSQGDHHWSQGRVSVTNMTRDS